MRETQRPVRSAFSWFARPSKGQRFLVLLVMVVIGFGVYRFINRTRVPTSAGPPGWMNYHDPTNGWTLQFPTGWHAQGIKHSYSRRRYGEESYGVLLSNIDRRVPTKGRGFEFDMRGLPSSLVAVQVSYSWGGPWEQGRPCTDTPMPLSLQRASRTTTPTGADETTQLNITTNFDAHGKTYFIQAWIGSLASQADREKLDRIVASISFERAPISTYDPGGNCGQY